MSKVFQIRLADTGHSQNLDLENISKGEQLINHISSNYSISPRDQLLVTKIGHLIKAEERLNGVLTQQRGDKTLLSKEYKQGLNVSHQRISCIYVFNLKELKQPIEKNQPNSDQYWKNQLKRNVESFSVLRPNVYTYNQNLRELFSETLLQSRPDIAKQIEQISKAFNALEYSWSQLGDIYNKIEQVIELCDNQRKCYNSLICLMASMIQTISKKASIAMKLLQKLKGQQLIDDRSLRQNSGCFQSRKKKEETILIIQTRLRQFKKKSEQQFKIMKIELKQLKSRFKQFDKKVLQFGNKSLNTVISQKLNQEKGKYQDIIEMFRRFQTTQDIKIIHSIQNQIRFLQRLLQEIAQKSYFQIYEVLIQYYKQFKQMNLQNKNFVKEGFQCFLKWKKIIDQYQVYVSTEEQAIQSLSDLTANKNLSREPSFLSKNSQSQESSFLNLKSQKEADSFRYSLKNDFQAMRRVQFYKRINFINNYLGRMCAEEQQLRKKYIKDNNLSKQKGKQLLKNYNVPTIDVDYEGTTDMQLFKSNKLALVNIEIDLTAQQFMISQYLQVQEKVSRLLSKESNNKVKNLQEILKSMSEIFLRIYTKKEEQKNRQCNQLSLKLKETQTIAKNFKETSASYQQKILRLQKELKQKSELISLLQTSRSEQLAKQKTKTQKLMSDKRILETNINKQIKMNQDLYNQVSLHDQEMSMLKQKYQQMNNLFGQREVYIIKLQQQLAQKQKNAFSVANQMGNLSQIDLKSVVLQNFGKKNEQSLKLQEQVKRLNQQIQILQNHNEQLEEENQYLSSELRKIITKECEDIECQTQEMPKWKQQDYQGIIVGEGISLNQKVIFMPFNSNTYVGVHQKDDEKTICNMSNLYNQNYILDLDSFDEKTCSLLSQCSFIVVLKVTKITRNADTLKVRGEIVHLLGFQDDNLNIKDYAPLLKK